ncbi:MAG: tRNA uridine-5-carboxymethylaminomethyl(34) synthesis GTPase MnmE [Bacilli bacterium]
MLNTIISLITPPLKGAVALIRLSGDLSKEIIDEIFTRKIDKPNHVYLGYIVNKKINEKIDQVLVTYFKAPHSYTGEDCVEISCHGSMLIVNQIIELCLSLGAIKAERGEFTMRAYYSGKMDLVQAEAVNDLINAQTEESKKLHLYSLEGETSKLLEPIKVHLADILSLIEVNIDYPEYEDIEQMTNDKIITSLDGICQQIDELIKDGKRNKLISQGIKVAIVGRPNVGKSSLLNALLKQDKAIVTSIPGTTRDVVEGQININGITLNLLDTAGIRDTEDVVEEIGVKKSKSLIEEADLVILVLEAGKLLEEDKELLELTKDKRRIIVYNKEDLISSRKEEGIYISALNKDITSLKNEISSMFELDKLNELSPSLCSEREIGLLMKTKNSLLQALEEAKNNISLDLVAISLKEGYDSIKDILGEEIKIDLSEEIFSRFCVGK